MQKQPVNLNILPKARSYMTAQSMSLNLGICLFNRSEGLGSQKPDQPAHSLCCRQTKPLTIRLPSQEVLALLQGSTL